ncbi:MAG: acyl carrier protein, partial [Proteobacteria bacterium]|nr:acyl carrier protein [Pseudomonadota bacterium]
MTENDIYKQLCDILAEEFELDAASITREAHLYEDLELDSIDAVDLIIRLQQMTG